MADFSLSDIKALMGDGDANGIVWVLLIVLLMGGGGSSGGTKFYDFSFAASSETRYFDKNLTANDFINAYLRDDTLNPGVILYIPILHVLDTGSEGISFGFIDPFTPTATFITFIYTPESGEVKYA